MNRDRLVARFIRLENEERFVYPDNRTYWTIGIGRCVDKRVGEGLSHEECLYLLNNDINNRVTALRASLSWFDSLDDNRQEVLMDMAFQMGTGGLLGFHHFLAHLKDGQYGEAAKDLLDSEYAKEDPGRAQENASLIRG